MTETPFLIRVSQSSGTPIYLQIVNQIKYLVASGRLRAGEELPPIRVLAEKLVINPNTVARAYRELEVERIVEKRSTNGTFVLGGHSPFAEEERIRILTERVDALLVEASQLQMPVEAVIRLVESRAAVLSEREPVK